MSDEVLTWGFHPDPYRMHQERYFSLDGLPTKLVRDGGIETYDPPPDRKAQRGSASPNYWLDTPVPPAGSEQIVTGGRNVHALMNSNRSALMVSAWVVGIPCGKPGYVLSVPF